MKTILSFFALILFVGCASTSQTERDPASTSDFEQNLFLKKLQDKNTSYDRVK